MSETSVSTLPNDLAADIEWLRKEEALFRGIVRDLGRYATELQVTSATMAADRYARIADGLGEAEQLRVELELERRKDHAYNAFTNGYNRAMEDYVAGRTAQWPSRPLTDTQVERAARGIADAWGYIWDVPEDHYCNDFCDYLCSEDADNKPTKSLCLTAARRALLAAFAHPPAEASRGE